MYSSRVLRLCVCSCFFVCAIWCDASSKNDDADDDADDDDDDDADDDDDDDDDESGFPSQGSAKVSFRSRSYHTRLRAAEKPILTHKSNISLAIIQKCSCLCFFPPNMTNIVQPIVDAGTELVVLL